jgi:hypothetical protein
MKKIKTFEITADGRLVYTQAIKDAVLSPQIRGLKIHLNGGFDWLDQTYGFIRLLLNRGQISEVVTHSDLLAHDDYLKAMRIGVNRSGESMACKFEYKKTRKHQAYASEKRIQKAHDRYIKFINE